MHDLVTMLNYELFGNHNIQNGIVLAMLWQIGMVLDMIFETFHYKGRMKNVYEKVWIAVANGFVDRFSSRRNTSADQ
ncbi:hypothetical protein MASR1M36_13110 [Candidatus Cloacimonadaceae bacterium]